MTTAHKVYLTLGLSLWITMLGFVGWGVEIAWKAGLIK